MDDLSNLNNELNSLSQDFSRHQELKQIRQNLTNDPGQTRINTKMAELTQFQGRYVRDDIGPIPYSLNQSPQMQNTLVDTRQYSYNQALQQNSTSRPSYPVQTGRVTSHTGVNGQYDSDTDPRQDMNSRLDRFRFESVNPTGSLVPVNMDHIYSGNLFADGLPIPGDLRDQFTLSSPNGHNTGARILHQEKSKTGYRNDVNDRLNKLSPLGRALYYPVTNNPTGPGQVAQTAIAPLPTMVSYNQTTSQQAPGQQYQPSQPQVTSRRGALTDDINSRMSSHPALGTAGFGLDENMVNYSRNTLIQDAPNMTPNLDPNRQVKKVVYQEMYPVMSNS